MARAGPGVSLVISLRMIPAKLGLEDRTRVKRLEAFRAYLKDFSDLPNAPALTIVIWEQYRVPNRARRDPRPRALVDRSASSGSTSGGFGSSSSSSGFSRGGFSGGTGGTGGGAV